VTAWDNHRQLYYYKQGVPFSSCATDSVGLLTEDGGSGQCGSWMYLLKDAMAVNGIAAQRVQVKPVARDAMLINTWGFSQNPTYPANAPFEYLFTPVIEASGDQGMVPPGTNPPPPNFGDLTNGIGVAGQNSTTPSEKFFGVHFIVEAPTTLDGAPTNPNDIGGYLYFDPSYGVGYKDSCDFETKAVAAYADQIAGTNNYYAEKPPANGCNVTLTVF
jgi:hypothetical protein